ncbi:MAG: TlyA family RNA methyltransferase [Chloroflexota bacterium]
MAKARLDLLLVERGLAESRAKAQALVMAGQVRVDGQVALKPATAVLADSTLTVDPGPRFVSRGGEKLDAALEAFGLAVDGLTCADVGASTGGFTDCLLQRGAVRVYAIDVGRGILHWKLRNDPRVIVMEETNARYVESLPERVDLVTIDASFISLKVLLPVVKAWLPPSPWGRGAGGESQLPSPWGRVAGGESQLPSPCGRGAGGEGCVVALIKPQFEAGRKDVSRGQGVIRSPQVHRQVLLEVLAFAAQQGFGVRGLIRSPIQGPKGNLEFLAWLGQTAEPCALEDCIEQVISTAG